LRLPCSAHARSEFLEEGAENLPLVLSQLHGAQRTTFLTALNKLFDGIVDVQCPVTGGTVSLFLEEAGGRSIPASRLSDGTLRYLSLLAILLHPDPPPLICIEEPELGLHPDLLPTLADLLVEASGRVQLVVTTHSDVLVDELTDRPESVVVCEKHDGKTEMRRLDKADLEKWLEDYRLGDLWTSGELGGNRW
jgi:predicted ATPase